MLRRLPFVICGKIHLNISEHSSSHLLLVTKLPPSSTNRFKTRQIKIGRVS